MQLAFPELVAAQGSGGDAATAGLLARARRHATGVRHALRVLAETDGAADEARCDLLRTIRRRHRGHQVVVFSQYAESVGAVFRRLRRDGRVAAVTAHGAWVAGGPMSRGEVLARFAPLAHDARKPSDADAIDVLLATDLLSEGLNLQDAAVVVHLDLPWTAARLTQRMGRVWRIGSRHDCVYEYALAPPAPAAALLRLLERLQRKAGAAWSAVGDPFAPLVARSAFTSDARDLDGVARRGPRGVSETTEALRRTLMGWAAAAAPVRHPASPDDGTEPRDRDAMVVAAVRSERDGWLALVGDDHDVQLVAGGDGRAATTEPARILEAATAAGGPPCAGAPSRVARVLREIDAHRAAACAADAAGVPGVGARAQALVANRIAVIAAGAPVHRRAAVSRLAAQARETVARAHSAGEERLLAALLPGVTDDESHDPAEVWLRRVIDTGSANPTESIRVPEAAAGRAAPLALILLVAK
jgi:hypothetical protein